ncbi:MAG TPA: hypothetical protein VGE74_15835 [Gemmata sp.]
MSVLVAAVSVLLIGVAPAPARFIEDWPYDKLFKNADVVVFAEATKTEPVADEPLRGHPWPCELVGQNTTFKVKHALKGKVAGDSIKVLHFKLGPPKKGQVAVIIENGPLLVAFRTAGVIVKAKGDEENTILPQPEYLLFLKKMKDGRYEPVSGRIDPALSVKEVSAPLEKVLGGGK